MSIDSLSQFEARCLAEALRLRERAQGRLEDAAAMVAARSDAVGFEPRIVARAGRLAARAGLEHALETWSGRVRMAALVMLMLGLVAGVGAGLAVAGDGLRPINVVWALGGLLGLHVLSLLVWLAGLVFAGTAPIGFGALWSSLSARMASGAAEVPRAFVSLHRRAGLMPWWLGAATHAVWSMVLAGALAGLTASFLLRGHVFVWETTLLSPAFFVDLVAALGYLPALLGFPLPDAATVVASGTSALTDEAARRTWAWWLVGCVLVYGWLPRVLLWGGCLWRVRAGRSRLRLDVSLPGFAELAGDLAPASERMGVTDAAPASITLARIDDPHGFNGPPTLVGIELRGDRRWPPDLPRGVRDIGVADTREQRAQLRETLAASPARRLLVACDGRLSPDRGSLSLIADLSHHAGHCAVWLLGASGERAARWHEALVGVGLSADAVITDEAAALSWLAGEGA